MNNKKTKIVALGEKTFNRKYFLFWIVPLILAFTISLLNSIAWAENSTTINPKTIIVLGDSLSAGYRLPRDDAFPEQLEAHFKTNNHNIVVKNAGVSGDTTADGLARLGWVLPQDPKETVDLVILELGGNDVLRGLEPKMTKENLHQIILELKAKNIPVLLAGMLSPPNMGREYEAEFNQIYPDLAKLHAIPLYPFFLEGVADKPDLLLPDGLHPTREGIAIMVKNISPFVLKALEQP
jgi:acyl-CoA thioesterase-1